MGRARFFINDVKIKWMKKEKEKFTIYFSTLAILHLSDYNVHTPGDSGRHRPN